MPRLFAYDTSRHVLVLELIPGGETLAEYQRRYGGFPVHAASQLGGLLGAFHHAAARGVTASMQPLVFPRRVPWVLSIHQQQPEFFPALSAGNAQLLEIVKRYSDFAATLDPLRAQWRRDGLMHGDLKWDNCILHANGGNPASLRWKLIDWEMGDEGDFAWDIATLLQAFLVNWVLSLPLDDRAITMADLSLEQMQPAMAAFWSSYVAARCFAEEQSHSELMRCVSYAGARMIQSAFECLYYAPQMTPPALRLLQASLNVLTRPEEARETLFGL
jgi:hypothetical protein